MRSRKIVAGAATLIALALLVMGPATVFGGSDVDRGSGYSAASEPAARISVGNGPCCLAVVRDGVWVMNQRDMTIQRIDPETNTADEPIDVDADGMSVVGPKLLLTDYHGGSQQLFDPHSAKRTPIKGFSSAGT